MGQLSKKTAIRLGLAVCLFLIVLGSRWAVVNKFGTDLPSRDQWDAEGAQILSPWMNHRLTAADFLRPQNGHRLILTKLVNFALTVANGQWDQRVECAVNAVLPGLIAAALFIALCRRLSRRWHAPVFLLLAAAYGLPLGWESILGGLHSAQFFLIGLSIGAITGLSESKPGSRSWWLGAACAVLAMGSLATGFFAAAVVTGLLAVRLGRREILPQAAAPALLLCAALVAVGWITRVNVDYGDYLRARAADGFAPVLHSLTWPGSSASWPLLILWLPWGWLLRRVLEGAGGAGRTFGYTLAGLGAWVILQIIATAYAPGTSAFQPSSRYVDILLFGAVVNGVALVWLWQNGELAARTRPFFLLLGAGWVLAFGWGAAGQTHQTLASVLPSVKAFDYYCEQNTRNYLVTGDEAYLEHNEIPYPGPASYKERLDLPGLRSLLPSSVRAPLTLASAGGETGFIRHDSRSPQGAAVGQDSARTGFSPATPPLANSVTWGSYGRGSGVGRWESEPVPAPHPGWLNFEVAGQLGEAGNVLELRDAVTRAPLGEVRLGKTPGDAWHSARVRAPPRAFVVTAADRNPRGWLAFGEPVEAGPLSHWVSPAIKYGLAIAGIAVLAAGLLALLANFADGVETAPSIEDITFCPGRPWDFAWGRRWAYGGRSAPPWLATALRSAFLVLATTAIWLMLLDLPRAMVGVDLDASWEEVLVQAHLKNWQFGQDLIFSYGPWGFLSSHFFPPGALAIKFAWEIAGKIAMAAGFVALSSAIPGRRRWVFLVAAPFFLEVFPDTAVLLFITLAVLVWLLREETPPWLTGAGVLALAFLAEMKFTDCLLGGIGVGAAVAAAAWSGRWRRALVVAGAFAAAFMAFWLAAGQQAAHLYDFFRYTLDFSRGYGWGMSVDETGPVFLAGAAAMLLNLAFAAQLWRARPMRPGVRLSALFFAAASFLAWKHGFLRADDHVYGFFSFSVLMALALPGLVLPGRRGTWIYANIAVCLLGMWLADPDPITQAPGSVWRRSIAESAALLHPKALRAGYDADERSQRAANRLPALRAAVGRGTIDMTNYEQGLLLINGLDYRPRPLFQSYATLTPGLMEKNLDFYLSARAPDFVLLRLGSVDAHYPMEDDGLMLAALPLRYTVMPDSADGALLRRKGPASAAPNFTRQPVSAATASFGEDIPLPAERDHALWMRAEFPLSLLGELRAFLYKPPLLYIVVTEEGGAQVRYRIVPPMAAEGFVIQPTIETTGDYAAFARGRGLKWARAVRFEPAEDEGEFLTQVKVEFFQVPELPMRPTIQTGTHQTRPRHFEQGGRGGR